MQSVIIEFAQEMFTPAAFAHFEGDYEPETLEAGPDEYTFAQPAHWAIDVSNTGEALYLAGCVQALGSTLCARCLEPTDIPLTGDLEGYYVLDGADAPEGMEGDEYEILPADHRIDIEPMIRAALLLDVPNLPLCSEECQGLCPTCGANLNEGECDCAKQADEEIDESNPFAVLKNLQLE